MKKNSVYVLFTFLSPFLFITFFHSLILQGAYASTDVDLPREMTAEEARIWPQYLERVRATSSRSLKLPTQGIHSLGEWEESEAVMVRWSNMSLIKALTDNGKVKILATSTSDKATWEKQLQANQIDPAKYSFYVTPLNSMWVRDYGPWWIVDGRGEFGIVDNIYNRPRPDDDIFPEFVAKDLQVPIYKTNLVHTGGNYYSDGLDNAFSSTLVFSENSNFTMTNILERMLGFLGIKNYLTSELGKSITIEHLDTFGKLVAPDTWVFSEFSKDSQFYADSERMVQKLQLLKSPYGTPYKIFRLKMILEGGSYFRAYINSFVSNGVLYFPSYGDNLDLVTQATYQQALPGFKIVPVDNKGTEWGDSVHCRTRNLMKKDTIFIFPKIEIGSDIQVNADIFTPNNTSIQLAEVLVVEAGKTQSIPMKFEGEKFTAHIPKSTTGKTQLYIRAKNSEGLVRTHPRYSPIVL